MTEKEINIAAILKDKPKGTKLYGVVLGEVELEEVLDGGESYPICVKCNKGDLWEDGEEDELFTVNGYYYEECGEVSLFPSKQMRDWEKFAWKEGDVLHFGVGSLSCIFDGWHNDDYTKFNAKDISGKCGGYVLETKDWSKEINKNAIKEKKFDIRDKGKMKSKEAKTYLQGFKEGYTEKEVEQRAKIRSILHDAREEVCDDDLFVFFRDVRGDENTAIIKTIRFDEPEDQCIGTIRWSPEREGDPQRLPIAWVRVDDLLSLLGYKERFKDLEETSLTEGWAAYPRRDYEANLEKYKDFREKK